MKYCIPNDSGSASTADAVAKRLTKLINGLNLGSVTSGPCDGEVSDFRRQLMTKLIDEDGWIIVSVPGRDGWTVYPHNSPTGLKYKRQNRHVHGSNEPYRPGERPDPEAEKFTAYVLEFYGPDGIYPMGATKAQVEEATATLKASGADVAYDSVDREKVRDIMIEKFGLVFTKSTV